MLNYLVYNNLIGLKNSNIANKIFVELSYNYLFIYILNFLYRKGFILGYVYNNYKKVRVYLKYYKDKGLLNNLRFYFRKPYMSFKALKYIKNSYFYENYLYLLSTSFGFLTLRDIFFYNYSVGGILYFYLVN
jgi:ribosomal protein S8